MKIRARQLTEEERMLVCRALRSWNAGDTQEDAQKEALVAAMIDGEVMLVERDEGGKTDNQVAWQ